MSRYPTGPNRKLNEAADAVAELRNADVLLYNGPIQRPFDSQLIDLCEFSSRRPNVLLILVTPGGDPDAAYRMARCLQRSYSVIACLVSGYCKSAGTLMAIGAHELIFGPHGELGPIDVQMSKQDDLYEMQSGQTVMSALEMLEEKAFAAFEHYFLEVQEKSKGRVSLRAATEIAARLAVGVFSPIYQQIDPMHLGEAGRASLIANLYGERLDHSVRNLKPGALTYLTSGYTSHGFVIDLLEASALFQNVRSVCNEERQLCNLLADRATVPVARSPAMAFLSTILKKGEQHAETSDSGDAPRQRSKPQKAASPQGPRPPA